MEKVEKVTAGYNIFVDHTRLIEKEAKRLDRSKSWVVRQALDEYFARPETERDGSKSAVKP